jgi:uncharacterized membrane protein
VDLQSGRGAVAGEAVASGDRRSRGPLGSALVSPAGLIALATIASAAWVAALLVNRVNGLAAPPYDLAFFQQVVWNVGVRGLWVSNFHEGSFLGLHFSPILLIPAAIERLVGPDVRVLNLLHALAVAALVPAAFLFLRVLLRPSRFGPALAAVLAIGIPVWGTMQDVIRSDFHPETAGIGLALLAGWAGLSKRHRAMWALAVVALATREDVSYAVAVVGLAVAVRGHGPTRRHGRFLVLVAAAWAIAVFGLVMPAFRAGLGSDTDSYYAWLGGGLAVLWAPLDQTSAVAVRVARATPWLAAVGMVVALLGLPLARPRWLALALPPMAASLLSSNEFQANLRLQYGLILVAPLIVAAGFGGRRVLALVGRRVRRGRWRHAMERRPGRLPTGWLAPLVAVPLILPAAAGAWIQGSLPPFDPGDPAFAARPASLDRLWLAASVVPADAPLAADEGLLAPLAARSDIRRFTADPVPAADAYVVMDRMAWWPTPRVRSRHTQVLDTLLGSDRAVLVDDGQFIVWGPEPDGVTP